MELNIFCVWKVHELIIAHLLSLYLYLIFYMYVLLIDPKSFLSARTIFHLNVFNNIIYLIPFYWRYLYYSLLLLYFNLYCLLSRFNGDLLFWDFSLSSLWSFYHWNPVLGIPFLPHISSFFSGGHIFFYLLQEKGRMAVKSAKLPSEKPK